MADKQQSVLSWRISKEEMDKQVTQYSQLKPYQSFRGISALILSFGLLAGTLVSVLLGVSSIELLFGAVLTGLFIYFIYKGHRWAMVVSILAFTTNIGMSGFERSVAGNFTTTSVLFVSIVWIFLVGYLVKAIRIENHRRKDKYKEQSKTTKIEAKPEQVSRKWSGQLTAFVKSNLHKTKLVLVLVTAILLLVFGYSLYSNMQESEEFCLNRIDYRSKYYILRDGDWKITRFKTKDEAMEYCLTFLKTEVKKPSANIKKQGLTLEEIRSGQEKKSYTLDEIFNAKND